MKPLLLAILQLDSLPDIERNLSAIADLAADAVGADILVLPEVCLFRGSPTSISQIAAPLDGYPAARLADIASQNACWLVAGSLAERDGDEVYNTLTVFNRQGELSTAYRKMHLFEAQLQESAPISESEVYSAGDKPVGTTIEQWRCGLSICFDIRFPELYRSPAMQNMDMTFIPSDFTKPTGEAHWEVLCRSRAIENQCYVVAPNQCGTNRETGTESYGHSLVIDPWGNILLNAGTVPGLHKVEIAPELLHRARNQLPLQSRRRL